MNIKNFDSNLLKIDKKSYKSLDIYYIRYITIKNIGDYESIHRVNPLYLIIDKPDGYIEESDENKYQFLLPQIKTNKYWKSTQKFGMKRNI